MSNSNSGNSMPEMPRKNTNKKDKPCKEIIIWQIKKKYQMKN